MSEPVRRQGEDAGLRMKMTSDPWQRRSPARMSDGEWSATISRVRGEFEEMPCMRVTPEQARSLLGLSEPSSSSVLSRLVEEGFLALTPQGEYIRRSDAP